MNSRPRYVPSPAFGGDSSATRSAVLVDPRGHRASVAALWFEIPDIRDLSPAEQVEDLVVLGSVIRGGKT